MPVYGAARLSGWTIMTLLVELPKRAPPEEIAKGYSVRGTES